MVFASIDSFHLIATLIKIGGIYAAILTTVPLMIWAERRGAALIQDRPGPNRLGPLGLIQPVADAIKFFWKEDPVPSQVNKFLYNVAPFCTLLPASLILAALPVGDSVLVAGRTIFLQIADLEVGVLYMLAISSLSIYGIMFGGWASNNKFALIGAMRASSQVISYEIPMALAAVAVVAVFGTFSLREIGLAQEGLLLGFLPNWGVFYQPLGFLLFLTAAFAETNRLPFDLPESEAELVGGFHTEYGSMKFATFFMAEYMSMAAISGLLTTLYMGSWHLPYISDAQLLAWFGSVNLVAVVQVLTFFFKMGLFLLFFVWVRWTLPRFRYDQLMVLAWSRLIPIAIFNLVVTAVWMYGVSRL